MKNRNWAVHAVFVSMLCLVGCAGESQPQPEQPLSWEEFRARVYQEPDTGIFIVNGDEPILNEPRLREFYDWMIDQQASADGQQSLGETQQSLTVSNLPGGWKNRWSVPEARNLTYCISSTSFDGVYSAVVSAMHTAAADWQATGANLSFVHVSSLDSSCDNTTDVTFNVRLVLAQPFNARAFFPGYPRDAREILINNSAFSSLTGILRHELGHVLGFRHEHIRVPQQGNCLEYDTYWKPLTPYDSASVMHYQGCNGATNTGDLQITPLDAVGVRLIYPVALLPDQSLATGQSLTSSDGRFKLLMQTDGNLVLYWNGQGPLWATNTGGSQGKSAWMQKDGNFVLYTTTTPTAGNYLWQTQTYVHEGAYLALQNDGNLVIYDKDGFTPLWASNTGGR